MDIPRWNDVGIAKRVRSVGKACSSCWGSKKRGVGEASSRGVAEVSSGGVGSSRRGDVRVSRCKPPVGAGIDAIGALARPSIVARAQAPAGGKQLQTG